MGVNQNQTSDIAQVDVLQQIQNKIKTLLVLQERIKTGKEEFQTSKNYLDLHLMEHINLELK